MTTARRAAREAALTILFALDAGKLDDAEEALRLFRQHLRDDPEVLGELFAEPEEAESKLLSRARHLIGEAGQWEFVERLVRGATSNRKAIDDLITRYSLNWKVSRMSRVDRNILRLAVFELAFEGDVPSRATLNEAIEIAKRYGTEDSGKFVNGILDRIAQELERL